MPLKKNRLPLLCRLAGLEVEGEYTFLPPRRFRFDWANKDLKIAVEFEGIPNFKYGDNKSRHVTLSGYTRDAEKYNLAAAHGWTVLRFTRLSSEAQALELIERAVTLKRGKEK